VFSVGGLGDLKIERFRDVVKLCSEVLVQKRQEQKSKIVNQIRAFVAILLSTNKP
jgi:hypothetical protein